ncbi:MAG: putative ribonuclease inhibitor RraA/dimethylmenaquinone methyltransferase [Chloroflexi bacterium]|nr:putative ribonuclease inhibitor RraA/dimethylmenaquinone methyltransferase [Chloroflexota bacterium]
MHIAFHQRLSRVDTGAVSDALDQLGIRGAVHGIRPIWQSPRIAGPAMTVKAVAAGPSKPAQHINVHAIAAAEPGAVLVIDNSGRPDVSCMGELQSLAAKTRGLAGAVIDGACRDVDAIREMGFPVFTRAVVPITARGRIQQEAWNVMVQVGGVQVRPGDWVIADGSGVAFIPADRAEEVISAAEEIVAREEAMADAIRYGRSIVDVMAEFNYERMLERH